MTRFRCGLLAAALLLAAAPAPARQDAAGPSLPDTPGAPRGAVAVLPFANLAADAAHDWVGAGIAAALINDLQRRPAPRPAVIPLPRQALAGAIADGAGGEAAAAARRARVMSCTKAPPHEYKVTQM